MEIIRFKKGKKNIYEVELDNGSILKLYDDVIVKYNLIVNKHLTDKSLKEITDYNDSLFAQYDVLKKLNTKLRCEKELRELLKKKEYNEKIINETISKLKKDGYLNRELYIKSYINDAYNFGNDGPNKIRFNLNKLGFKNEEIDQYLNQDYTKKAIRIIDKKIKSNNKSNYIFKEKMVNYLINLGYSKEIFIDYLNNININDEAYLKKEAIQLINKYQKKYENEKLLYFIKDKLYKKGYNIERISEVLNDLL